MKNAWPSENKGERVRTGAVKRVVNVSVYSGYLMKLRLLCSQCAPGQHLSFHLCAVCAKVNVHLQYNNKNNNNNNNNNNNIVNVSVYSGYLTKN